MSIALVPACGDAQCIERVEDAAMRMTGQDIDVTDAGTGTQAPPESKSVAGGVEVEVTPAGRLLVKVDRWSSIGDDLTHIHELAGIQSWKLGRGAAQLAQLLEWRPVWIRVGNQAVVRHVPPTV
jgi:hypothetical protein